MQPGLLSHSFKIFYFQHIPMIRFVFIALMVLLIVLGTQGVVLACGVGTAGGGCSGCPC
jgi:hypothetical protein